MRVRINWGVLVEKNAGNEKMAAIDEVNKRVAEWKAEYEAKLSRCRCLG